MTPVVFFPTLGFHLKNLGVHVCYLCVLIYYVLTASFYCLVNASHFDLSSTDNELVFLQLYYLYAGFIYYSRNHMLFGFCKIYIYSFKMKKYYCESLNIDSTPQYFSQQLVSEQVL